MLFYNSHNYDNDLHYKLDDDIESQVSQILTYNKSDNFIYVFNLVIKIIS